LAITFSLRTLSRLGDKADDISSREELVLVFFERVGEL
jgi:hypothetical protein